MYIIHAYVQVYMLAHECFEGTRNWGLHVANSYMYMYYVSVHQFVHVHVLYIVHVFIFHTLVA